MIKFLVKISVLTLFFTNFVLAEILNKITITGNKRISEETIKVLGNISTKKDFNEKNLNNLLKNLYETNFFADIDISLKNGELKIDVIENPIIESVEITGVKNKTFIEEILDIIVLKDRMSFSDIQLEKDVDTIKNTLTYLGFICIVCGVPCI